MTRAAILVVDDNPANLKLTRLMLSSEGYDVCTAASAEEALQQLAKHQPLLILMDVQLPDIDGLTLTRKLKEDPATRGIAVLALTGYAMKRDEELAIAAGCDGYLAKPIDCTSLLAAVAQQLARAAE